MKQILFFSEYLTKQELLNHEVRLLELFKETDNLSYVEQGYMRSLSISNKKLGEVTSDAEFEIIAMPVDQFLSQWNDNDLRVKLGKHSAIVSNYEEVSTFKVKR